MEHELSAGVLKVLLEGAAVDQMGGVVPGCRTGTLAFDVLVVEGLSLQCPEVVQDLSGGQPLEVDEQEPQEQATSAAAKRAGKGVGQISLCQQELASHGFQHVTGTCAFFEFFSSRAPLSMFAVGLIVAVGLRTLFRLDVCDLCMVSVACSVSHACMASGGMSAPVSVPCRFVVASLQFALDEPGACTGTKAVDELMVEAAHFWVEGVLNGGQPLELLGCEASPTAVSVNTELFLAESGVPVCSRAGREASASTSDGGSWVSVRSSRSHRNSRSGSFWWQGEAKPQAAFARRGFSGDPFAPAAG